MSGIYEWVNEDAATSDPSIFFDISHFSCNIYKIQSTIYLYS